MNDIPHDDAAISRPSIGLALGGGVARGWAHIGVVQRLDELGVKPDIVCGTSVGALVGGFWLAGKLDALETWARGLNKRRMLSYFDVVLNGSGLMGGKRLAKAMDKFLPATNIEDLDQKFIAVTAELATGHEIWLRNGDLGDAMQAAYALPGVFPPRAVDGRWLIDGALVNPVPVSTCRAFGARLVIAVGLHSDAFGRAAASRRNKFDDFSDDAEEDLERAAGANIAERLMLHRLFHPSDNTPGVGSVMLASFNILMDRITRSRLAGDPPDVMMTPQCGHIPLLDFDRADELIQLGREAVDRHMPEIERSLQYLSI
ncbi:MAG: patatin-like phospholipase family protein [Pseudomonadota bacterium]